MHVNQGNRLVLNLRRLFWDRCGTSFPAHSLTTPRGKEHPSQAGRPFTPEHHHGSLVGLPVLSPWETSWEVISQACRPCPSTLRLAFLLPSPQGNTTLVSQHNASGHHTPGYVVHSHNTCGWTYATKMRVSTPTAACHPGLWGRQYCAHQEKRKHPTTHTHTPRTFHQHSHNSALSCWLKELERVLCVCVCVVGGAVEWGWAAAGPHPGESPSSWAPMCIQWSVCDATSQLHLHVLLTRWSDMCCDRPASMSLICGSKVAPTWSVPSLSTWAVGPPWGRVP